MACPNIVHDRGEKALGELPLAIAPFGIDMYNIALRVVNGVVFVIFEIGDMISPFAFHLGMVDTSIGAEIVYLEKLLFEVDSHRDLRVLARFGAREGAGVIFVFLVFLVLMLGS
ncbi:hypothetical protein F5Y14DRAFT_400185 [Nemania sp. NC0429]|nr:hypothetical protein F5Y14DRAFT_400185 [Nemania sp. NC0429]